MAATLGRLKFPGLIKLPLIITIRFIPTFINDLLELRQAVSIRFRGRGGLKFWLLRPRLWWRVFFMPLVIRLIRSADELALATELKGLTASTDFGGGKLAWGSGDKIILSLGALSISAAWLARNIYALG
jgi:energy-coupling factor transport system permease protein